MTFRRNNARLVWWASPLWSSLLLAGCDSVPRAAEPLAVQGAIDARGSADSALQPCADPPLQTPGDRADRVLAASHPEPLEVERLPLIPRPFPTIDAKAPLPAMMARQAAPRAERPHPHPAAAEGPALLPAGGAEEPAFGPPPAPLVTEERMRELGGYARPEPIRSTPPSAVRPAPQPDAEDSAGPPPWLVVDAPPVDAVAPAPLVRLAPEVQRALPLNAPHSGPAPAQAWRPARSPEIEAVARQAERQVRRGYDLAARGALYSARSQFIQALRTIAQALDVQAGVSRHSDALAEGLTALEEAEDFVPRGSRLEADLNIGLLVRGHRTPALKQAAREELVAVVAQQRYYAYAQERLTAAAGSEEAGSMALFGLGKTYGTLAAERSPQVVAAEPKAMVFHQAALKVAPGNYLAANELAVLAARYGRYETARSLLQHSAALAPRPEIWRNLAIVHGRLGEVRLAKLAEEQAVAAAEREAAGSLPKGTEIPSEVEWVDAKTFAATSKPASDLQKPAEATSLEPEAPAAESAANRLAPWLRQSSQQEASAAARR